MRPPASLRLTLAVLTAACSAQPAVAPPNDAATDASRDSARPDADGLMLDGGISNDADVGSPDAEPDASFADGGMRTDCEIAGYVCVAAGPLACSTPDMLTFVFSCGEPGRVCCIPASGSPAPCEDSRGMCIAPAPMACRGRIGEPEIYLCPAGLECCLERSATP